MPAPTAGLGPAIGARAKALREASGLGLREVARRVGVAAPYLKKVEDGGTPNPGIGIVAGLALVHGVTVGQLIGEEPLNPHAREEAAIEQVRHALGLVSDAITKASRVVRSADQFFAARQRLGDEEK